MADLDIQRITLTGMSMMLSCSPTMPLLLGRGGDYLAWIYMLDNKEGLIFNIANTPAPDDSILADGVAGGTQEGSRGMESNSAKTRKKKAIIDDIGKAINESDKAKAKNVANLCKYVVNMYKPFAKEIKNWMEEIDAASDSISKLSKQEMISSF